MHARASWCSPGEGSDPLKSSTREHPRQKLQAADVYGLKAYHERGQAGCKRKPNHTPTTYEPAFACIAKRRREHIPLGVASVFATLLVTGQAVSTSAELHTRRTRARSTRQLQPSSQLLTLIVSSLSSSHLMVTEARYVDAGRVARMQHGGALGDLHGLAVHRHRDGLQRRPARAQRSRPLPSSASPRPNPSGELRGRRRRFRPAGVWGRRRIHTSSQPRRSPSGWWLSEGDRHVCGMPLKGRIPLPVGAKQ